jgi:cytochrome-b5 reductase
MPPRPEIPNASALPRKYLDGIVIPVALLLLGTYIVQRDWMPYAIALASFMGMIKYFSLQPIKVLNPEKFQEFELKEKTVVSHNVAIYRFKLPTPTSVLGLPIGQHISIGAEIEQADGKKKEIVRSYTPISGDHVPGHFDLLIKSYPTGNISKYMAGLQVGQSIKVKGPKGAFVYSPNMVRHFGMIAGGTGITPMLQIVRAIVRGRIKGDKTEVDLIFANVTQADILLKEDLDELAKEDPRFRVHYALDKAPEGWTGEVGYVTEGMITVRAARVLNHCAENVVVDRPACRNTFQDQRPMSRSLYADRRRWSAR